MATIQQARRAVNLGFACYGLTGFWAKCKEYSFLKFLRITHYLGKGGRKDLEIWEKKPSFLPILEALI